MSISTEVVQSWFSEAEEELYELDLMYAGVGDKIDLESIPRGYSLEIVSDETSRDRDSYGSLSVYGFLVFSVTGPDGDSAFFKLPMSYASYDGWSFDSATIVPTAKQEKVVTSWEWV